MFVHIVDEVGLALQLPLQLLGVHEAECALLRVCDLLRFHSIEREINYTIRQRDQGQVEGIELISEIKRAFVIED